MAVGNARQVPYAQCAHLSVCVCVFVCACACVCVCVRVRVCMRVYVYRPYVNVFRSHVLLVQRMNQGGVRR